MVRLTVWDDNGREESMEFDDVDKARKALAGFRSQHFTWYRLEWATRFNLQESHDGEEVLVEDGELPRIESIRSEPRNAGQ